MSPRAWRSTATTALPTSLLLWAAIIATFAWLGVAITFAFALGVAVPALLVVGAIFRDPGPREEPPRPISSDADFRMAGVHDGYVRGDYDVAELERRVQRELNEGASNG